VLQKKHATEAKALVIPSTTARLKSCPDTKHLERWLEISPGLGSLGRSHRAEGSSQEG
jgi:hypothetical protein